MLGLCRCGRPYTRVMGCGRFRRGWPGADAARPAVIADVGPIVHNDVPVVDIRDVDAADVRKRAVVEESPTAPLSADEPDTSVAKAVADAAIEANGRPPVAFVPRI
jgi:hypothetical protein